MVLTVIIVFCVCWTPNQSLLLWDVYRDRHQKPPDIKHLHYISLYVAYASSAINPVIYYLYNKCFRHALHTLLKTRCKRNNTEITVSPETLEEDVEMTVTSGGQSQETAAMESDDVSYISEEIRSEQIDNEDLNTVSLSS